MLQGVDYCPVLHARIAEMKALGQLSSAARDKMFPLIVARPWPNAKHLARTWEKISEAFGERRFALDLDHTRRGRHSERPAAGEFDELFDEELGHSSYYEAVEAIPEAVPVLRAQSVSLTDLDEEIENVVRLDRGLIVRLQHDRTSNAVTLIEQVLERYPEALPFIDLGWSRDLLGRMAWASSIMQRLSDRFDSLEIVLCGSSFPDTFTNIDRRGEITIDERAVFAEIVRRHNAPALVYGDWASTYPPRESTPMNPVPRIDLPQPRQWISFRSDDETYSEIARRVILDPEWPDGLNIWGTYVIESTADEQPGAIKSPAAATAARINIHMHRQVYFDAPEEVSDADEPFTDDL